MEKTKDQKNWKKQYTIVLIANAIYIFLFYMLTSIYS